MEDTSDTELIKRCINISCVEKKDANNNIFSFGWTTSLSSFKDSLIYNYFRFNSKFEIPSATIHIYNKIYNNANADEQQKINEKISKIIYVSYRSRYKPQINSKNNKTMDKNLDIIKNKYLGMDSYIKKLNSYGKKDIIEIDPPFSIHKIVIFGEKFGRTCGEWFSDFDLPKIYNIINTAFDIIPNLSIIHFNSFIELQIILERCFKDITSNNNKENENKYDEIKNI